MNTPAKIIVIGAGICGLSAAIWLRRDGHEVTLIDREGPGAGASYGNAGLLAQWAIAPINSPGIIRQGIKSLADPNAPLFLQYSYLPRLLPWLLRYVAQGTDTRTQRMAAGLHNLLHDSVEQHRALT
ncbi:MAG TPA: FAD-dependent oxidoreductase, partial [Roseovarius nubinhibens]|nr:FAD-dependent oxidoreductase [Roseovarius nubinhibens]